MKLHGLSYYQLPTASYELNLQCGSGEADSAVHAGMLNIAVSPFKKTWQKVKKAIAIVAIAIVKVELGKKIVEKNIALEIQLTKEKQRLILLDQMHGCPCCAFE